jgi:O-acetyl-ADP-ribose deacetylase (regulator of RNase III)
MERTLSDVVIECVMGDITRQEGVDAVVNAANANLGPGGGVAGAIHGAAGPGLAEECRPFAPITPGQAVITGGHHLPNPYVIHCLGPVYGKDQPSNLLLADCYRNALRLAEEQRLASVAFPSIATGIFEFPLREAAVAALGAVVGSVESLRSVRLVRFVLFDERALLTYEEVLAALVSQAPHGERIRPRWDRQRGRQVSEE